MKKPNVLTLSGPRASGKTTLLNHIEDAVFVSENQIASRHWPWYEGQKYVVIVGTTRRFRAEAAIRNHADDKGDLILHRKGCEESVKWSMPTFIREVSP